MKKHHFISALIMIHFFLVILLGAAFATIFDSKFYATECNKLETDCVKTLLVLDFLKYKSILGSDFNSREVKHMIDVRMLISTFITIYIINLLSLILTAFLILKYKGIDFKYFVVTLLMYGGSISILLVMAIALSIFMSFDVFFDLFHKPFFSQGTWVFGEDDLLIKLFPIEFFESFTQRILFNALLFSIISIVLGLAIRKFK